LPAQTHDDEDGYPHVLEAARARQSEGGGEWWAGMLSDAAGLGFMVPVDDDVDGDVDVDVDVDSLSSSERDEQRARPLFSLPQFFKGRSSIADCREHGKERRNAAACMPANEQHFGATRPHKSDAHLTNGHPPLPVEHIGAEGGGEREREREESMEEEASIWIDSF